MPNSLFSALIHWFLVICQLLFASYKLMFVLWYIILNKRSIPSYANVKFGQLVFI